MPAPDGSSKPTPATYEEYWVDLREFFAKKAHSPAEIDDLVQEVRLRLLRYPKKEELLRDPRDYIFKVAWNVFNNYAKKHAKAYGQHTVTCDPSTIEQFASSAGATLCSESTAESLDIQLEIDRVLKKLPREQRAILLLHIRDGWSHKQVAEKLSTPEHEVRKWFRAALQACRKHLRRGHPTKSKRGAKP